MLRRMRALKNLEAPGKIRIIALIFQIVSLTLILITAAAFWLVAESQIPDTFWSRLLDYAPLYLGIMLLGSLALIAVLAWKCRQCRSRAGGRIVTALTKMSQGDLGWKLTLHRGEELAGVADSASKASACLADRINKLRLQTRQLTEVENYLIDSLEAEQITNPYTLKALRKLKICTSRLSSRMEEFHISTLNDATQSALPKAKPRRKLQKV